MTQDDTWAATMLAEHGGGDAVSIAHHPMRHVLTNVLGARDATNVHMSEHELSAGDTVMLCSDGLYGVLDDHALAKLMQRAVRLARLRTAWSRPRSRRGTRDNVTALVVRYEAEA